jgi:hypothetical protein
MAAHDQDVTARYFNCEFQDLASVDELISYLERQFKLGSGKAGFCLGQILAEGLMLGPAEVRDAMAARAADGLHYLKRSFELLHAEALAGDGEAMHCLALYYQGALPPLKTSFHPMFHFWVSQCRQTVWGQGRAQF